MTPADATAATDAPGGGSAKSGAASPGEPPAKHAADPVSSALALLEQALAGALAGAASIATAASTSGAPASAAAATDSGAIAGGKGGATALNNLLAQSLTADPKAVVSDARTSASNPTPTGTAAAAPVAAANTAAAALTAAAQLSSGSHLATQQGTADSSRMTLGSPVGTSAWTDELGTKLTWMAHQGIESASLQLSPEHLGPLQVTISVHAGQASVWFGAAQPDTRTALQQSLPQLRQLFAGQGLTLADAGVSRESPRDHGGQSSARPAAPVSGIAAASLESPGTRASAIGGLGLLDTYV